MSPTPGSTPEPMATMTSACGWVDLPKCKKRCWFAHLPAPEALRNYIAIMDDFGADLEMWRHGFQHLMIWELGHQTTKRATSWAPVDQKYHITVLASPDMTVGRFRAFAAHVYINGDIPGAKYSSFSSTYTALRRGNREKMVIDVSKRLVPPTQVAPRIC